MTSTTNTNIAQFSAQGLDIGNSSRTLTYLHGLSDFWVSTFTDTETVNLLLEANAVTASETYSRFLQLSAGISLEGLSHLMNSQIKLIFIKSSDKVTGTASTYTLPEKITSARFISNKPFLPTSSLEHGVDFHIDESDNTISFSKSISEYLLPFRTNTDGTREYSMWIVDARIDSDLIYNNYSTLIGLDKPERIDENFKNLTYGLFYLYAHGPSLDLIRRGLNLVLGVPLARDTELVLEIRKYLSTDQYIVITDMNSYIVPYGLEPSCATGDTLQVGDEIASWVEVKDYTNDGDWWINFMIPSHLIPDLPDGGPEINRYATEGSYSDYIMRNYLKTHTFLVNVKTVSFKNMQTFGQLSDIIRRIKPSYTSPIYVWTLPTGSEDIILGDDIFLLQKNVTRCATLTSGMARFRRDSTNPLERMCPQFTRFSVPAVLDEHFGQAPEINGLPRSLDTGVIEGFIYPQKQFRTMYPSEDGWVRAISRRDNSHYMPLRSKVGFVRNMPNAIEGTGGDPVLEQFPGYRLICLHTTTMLDVLEKFSYANEVVPDKYVFTLFKPTYEIDGINEAAINGSKVTNFREFILANFDKYFDKGSDINYLGPFCAKDNYRTYKPLPTDFLENDFLVFVKIVDYAVGVFWATQNTDVRTVPYWANEGDDTLTMDISGKFSRGMGPLGTPAYVIRGAGIEMTYGRGGSINTEAVNTEIEPSAYISAVNYSDQLNPIQNMDRSGKNLNTRKIMR